MVWRLCSARKKQWNSFEKQQQDVGAENFGHMLTISVFWTHSSSSTLTRSSKRDSGCRFSLGLFHFSPGNSQQVGSHHRWPDIGFKWAPSFPGAARQSQASFQPGDASFDTGSKAAQATIKIVTTAHIRLFETALFCEANVLYLPWFWLRPPFRWRGLFHHASHWTRHGSPIVIKVLVVDSALTP